MSQLTDDQINQILDEAADFALQLDKEERRDRILQVENKLREFLLQAELVARNELSKNELLQTLEELKQLKGNKKYVVKYGDDQYYTLTNFQLDNLYDLSTDSENYYSTGPGSDVGLLYDLDEKLNSDLPIEIEEVDYKENQGSYFKQTHTSKLDLKNYQILHSDCTEEEYIEINKEHCFINCMNKLIPFIEDEKEREKIIEYYNMLKYQIGSELFKSRFIHSSKPDNVCFTINKYELKNNEVVRISHKTYRKNKNTKYNFSLVLYKEHYMPNGLSYNNKRFEYKVNNKHYIMNILALLEKNNKLEDCKFNYKRNIINDDLKEEYLKEQNEFKMKKVKKPKHIYFADYESIVWKTSKSGHIPFMLGYASINSNQTTIITEESKESAYFAYSFTKMLNNIIRDIKDDTRAVIYFHNLKYDLSLLRRNRYITFINEVNKSNQVYSITIKYKKKYFELRDSFKLFSRKLADFQSTFGLKVGKKPFNYYNIIDVYNFKDRVIPLNKFVDLLREREQLDNSKIKIILEDLKDYINNNQVMFMKLYEEYLDADVQTLRQGLIKFNQIMEEGLDINIFSNLTISGLAQYYFMKEGCYEGLYSCYGNLQNYINKAIQGGRVCLRDNKKQIVEVPVNSLDAVSLYPSGIKLVVIPKGKAEYITDLNYNNIQSKYTQFIVTVKLNLNKYQQIPMASVINKEGIRHWTNTLNDYIIIDKITLEDLIKFHKAEIVDIKEGIGWSKENGINDNYSKTVQRLFNMRLEAKKNKNGALSEVIKLILNSAYGKTLLKGDNTKSIFRRNEKDMKSFISNNYNSITNIETYGCNDNFKITLLDEKSLNNNYAHVGCFILSQSKRIINEVLDLANDNGINIYYTDTDSIHIEESQIPKLIELYNKEYNKELIGDNLGQMHVDFESRVISNDGIHSRKFIGLGKKCYLDILSNSKGEEDYHIRFKGANSKNILQFCKDNKLTIEEFYLNLYKGEEIEIDICSGGVSRFMFKNGKVYTNKKLIKKFKF